MLRIATYNIHHGSNIDGAVDLEATAATIDRLEADVVALQELDRNVRRSGRVDQPAVLQELTGMHVRFFPTADFGGGEFGVAIATTDPADTRFRFLPPTPFDRRHGAIVSQIGGLTIVATHLSRKPQARAVELPALWSTCRKLGSPKVLLGDFNMSAAGLLPFRLIRLKKAGGFEPTFPSTGPVRQPDHVLMSRELTLGGCHTSESTASDHLPLVVELRGEVAAKPATPRA